VEHTPFQDERGSFARFFCQRELVEILDERQIVNVNFSHTAAKGAVRGMHYQTPPASEMKLVRCIRGAIFDVAVDIRKGSETFLQWHGEILTAENQKMLVLPEGFAHGFQTLTADCEIIYLVTAFYDAEKERSIHPEDPRVGIQWQEPISQLSEKDARQPTLDENFCGIKL